MNEIRLEDAEATLSAMIDGALRGQPSVITRRGRPEAVVVSFAEWQRQSRTPSFRRLLMETGLEPEDLPRRTQGLRESTL
ncbi:MAG: type II toxin-antitoxin system Phd/YefM family antitoxin [Gluconacetobacter diazotrophicus]|nr:type II toxin-antitoxin system Phd/YefM family antitoxin [Gluconacetobacter diazotrophicus]